jgi:hypothetical protein
MPENAVYVGRPSLWGNPYTIRDISAMFPEIEPSNRAAAAVRMYRGQLEHWGLMSDYGMYVTDARWDATDRIIQETGAKNMREYAPFALKGKDLVCWCPLDQPCHADVLLELAA